MLHRLRSALLADTPALSASERRYSAGAAMLGIAACLALLGALPQHYALLAPMGASAIILFGMSHSPVAQPWPVVGGYVVSCFAGLVSAALISSPWLAAGMAVAASLWLMARLNCIHPPGGALALLMVSDRTTYALSGIGTVALVSVNVALLLLSAMLINNLIPGRRYPHHSTASVMDDHGTGDEPTLKRTDLRHEDLASAIREMNTFVDISEDELVRLYNLAIDHAFSRHVGLRCVDVMSRDVITTHSNALQSDAWQLLQTHRIKALPVIDSERKLVGIFTLSDFFRSLPVSSDANEVTGQLTQLKVAEVMTKEVRTAHPGTAMADLVREVAQTGRHHVPVVDDFGRLVGMLTQSDMIAALYRRLAVGAVPE